jgi:hypothetical protein
MQWVCLCVCVCLVQGILKFVTVAAQLGAALGTSVVSVTAAQSQHCTTRKSGERRLRRRAATVVRCGRAASAPCMERGR